MPKVVVYVPSEEWLALQRRGEEPAAWVRALVKGALMEPVGTPGGESVQTGAGAGSIPADLAAGSVSASGGESAATGSASGGEGLLSPESPPVSKPPRGYTGEPFSLVCPRRHEHQRGVYCPECKGDGSKR